MTFARSAPVKQKTTFLLILIVSETRGCIMHGIVLGLNIKDELGAVILIYSEEGKELSC